MTLLSDGAFKLYVFLCLRVDRSSARLEIDQTSVAKSLAKSRRSVIVYFEELKQRGVCDVRFAANQHTRGVVQICDAFWPYLISAPAENIESVGNYIKRVRTLLETRRCVRLTFAPADEKQAQSLFSDHVPIEDIEHAFLLGCTRKYVSWLNGQASGPIVSFGYFRTIVDEVAQMDTSPEYWRYIGESLDKYERAWLAQTADGGCRVP
ncbi:MAG: hypothetical protein WAM85_00775 [Terracidiphilus sp.]